MTAELLAMCGAVLAVGAAGAAVTVRVAHRSLSWAAFLSPLTIVCSMAAGLVTGLYLMVIEEASLIILIIAATMPVALLVGVFVSICWSRVAARAREDIERERRRREVEEGRRELITWLSHDLRTPLAGIRAMGEAIEDGVAPDPSAYVRMMVAEAERTAEMVSDVMSLATLQNRGLDGEREEVSLTDLTSDMVSQLAPLADSHGMNLEMGEATQDVPVMGDPALLSRAVQNVIANAVQYSPRGSCIQVRVMQAGGYAQVQVRDECGGLSDEEREHMCEVGWRANTARTPTSAAGSGLGLPIVRTIAQAHGGDLRVENRAGGCCVIIAIPTA